MNEKTNDEINRIITERLFPEICNHNLDCRTGRWRCEKCGGDWFKFPERVKRDFCNSDADVREARGKIAEKGLQKEFTQKLGTIQLEEKIYDNVMFNLIHSTPLMQARAIVRVLEGLDDGN
jgi:hypothetical protein